MKTINRKFLFAVCALSGLLIFAIGLGIGVRLGQKNVMLEIEGQLPTYSHVTASCLRTACDDETQKLVVFQVDANLQLYELMEKQLSRNWLAGTYEIAAINILSGATVEKSLRSTQKLRSIFSKNGCGIDGKICKPSTRSP
jgi:hypothetical protein